VFLAQKNPLIPRSDHRSRILHGVRKNILLGVQKAKISLQSPKTEFEAKIDREFYMEQKNIYFWGQKGENEPSVPKNGI
jgi:hypothetical protein